MSLTIRRPDESALPGLFRCLQTYRLHLLGQTEVADPDFAGDALLSVRNAICHVNLAEKCWVAEQEGQILGFCCWDWRDRAQQSAKTILISVLPEARSLGIGSLLQQRRMDEMHEQGAREVHTWSDDPKAIRWYQERFGYELIGYEPIHHCLHCFTLGARSVWGIHRGFVERDQLAHLRRAF
ncbi:MAG TPA: GNAT family N-acetyltransferase [Chthonomonadaceae bacterium]|nr:GNAT family N-acetyltransferase [Chthonomonadaceae bacterium]